LTATEGGTECTAAEMAINRFKHPLANETTLRATIEQSLKENWMCQMWNVEM
jgi:hypothetical protein